MHKMCSKKCQVFYKNNTFTHDINYFSQYLLIRMTALSHVMSVSNTEVCEVCAVYRNINTCC